MESCRRSGKKEEEKLNAIVATIRLFGYSRVMEQRYFSPLRYPGGKQQLSEYVKRLIAVNQLYDGIYAEPYAGGAGVALDLLCSEYVRDIHLNDLDKNIASFWNCVVNQPSKLIERLESTPATVENWREQKAIIDNAGPDTPELDRGFATLFLNRCNRSGILDAGPIGGFDQNGPWKIDARYNTKGLAARIRRIARYHNSIRITNLDCLDFLEMEKAELLRRKSLTYLDPPYFVQGKNLYLNAYKPDDHKKVADFLECEFGDIHWIVSYDACEPIAKIYSSFRCTEQMLNYTASSVRKKGKEFMFYSPLMNIPNDVPLIEPVSYCKLSAQA